VSIQIHQHSAYTTYRTQKRILKNDALLRKGLPGSITVTCTTAVAAALSRSCSSNLILILTTTTIAAAAATGRGTVPRNLTPSRPRESLHHFRCEKLTRSLYTGASSTSYGVLLRQICNCLKPQRAPDRRPAASQILAMQAATAENTDRGWTLVVLAAWPRRSRLPRTAINTVKSQTIVYGCVWAFVPMYFL